MTQWIAKSRWMYWMVGALTVAIFVWGLSYKLSLYDPNPQTIQKIPAARMLSENERMDSQAAVLLTSSNRAALPFLCTAVLLALYRSRSRRCQAILHHPAGNPPRGTLQTNALTAFFFRPPPTNSASLR